jgi:predicted MPP superfamily phosphohydrolase
MGGVAATQRSTLRRVGVALAVLVTGVVGGWIALAVAGSSDVSVGPVEATVRLAPLGSGTTTLSLPPVGRLTADTHAGPLGLGVEVRAVSLERARPLLDDPTRLAGLQDDLVADLAGGLRGAVIRAVVVATVGGSLLALVVFRRAVPVAVAAAVAAGSVLVPTAVGVATVDTKALEQPTFSGLLTAAPDLVADVQAIASNVDAYGDQLARVVTHVTRLYEAGLTLPTYTPADETIRVLHVSDLHLNPTAWDVIRALAQQYDVDAIVDTGDIADQGSPVEAAYVQEIGTLGRPYVFVRGNHDSLAIEAAIAALPNAIVVDGTVQEVAGLRLLGVPDARFTPDRVGREGDAEAHRAAMAELARLAAEAEPPVDVLLTHDPTDAEVVGGTAPLLLAGHGHRRHVREYGETLVLVQGSTGGAGLRALEGEEPTSVALSVLYFDRDTGDLQAWDDVTLGGLGLTTATIQRVQADRAEQSEDVPDLEQPVAGATDEAEPVAPR